MPSPTPIVLFDLDGTLTRGDTLLAWLRLVHTRSTWLRRLPYCIIQLLLYKVRGGRADLYKERIVGPPLRGLTLEEGRRMSEAFVPMIERMLRPEAVERLRWHHTQRHYLVLLTASIDVAVQVWAEQQGFEQVIATEMAVEEGRYTGVFATPNCKGIEKVRRLDLALPQWRSTETYGYGDSPSDRPFLDQCTYGYYGRFE